MLQRKGAELVGQLARVPDPNTDAYGVFSIAIMTIWSKLDPVGAAETGRGEIRRATLNTESATNSNGNPIFFRVCSTLILFQSCLVGSVSLGDQRGIRSGSQRTRLFLMSEFPGNIHYCLKIHKGSFEPG